MKKHGILLLIMMFFLTSASLSAVDLGFANPVPEVKITSQEVPGIDIVLAPPSLVLGDLPFLGIDTGYNATEKESEQLLFLSDYYGSCPMVVQRRSLGGDCFGGFKERRSHRKLKQAI